MIEVVKKPIVNLLQILDDEEKFATLLILADMCGGKFVDDDGTTRGLTEINFLDEVK